MVLSVYFNHMLLKLRIVDCHNPCDLHIFCAIDDSFNNIFLLLNKQANGSEVAFVNLLAGENEFRYTPV